MIGRCVWFAAFAAVTVVFVSSSCAQNPVGHFWQLTDLHYDAEYIGGGDPFYRCTRTTENCTKPASPVGDYACDTSPALLQSVLAFMRSHAGDAFIMWTGDSPPHYVDYTWVEEHNKEMVLAAVQNVNDEIRRVFPSHRVFPAVGNHDNCPADFMVPPPEGSEWIEKLVATWEGFDIPTEALEEAKYGGFYSTLVEDGLRIVVLNTGLCDFTNPYALLASGDIGGQFAWLNKTLDAARENGEKVFLATHISPGADVEAGSVTWRHFAEPCDVLLGAALREYADVIVASFFGHEHRDSFRVFHDAEGIDPIGIGFVTPGMVPFTNLNPTVRLYHYDKVTKEILDYDQFYCDLARAIETGTIEWELLYNAKDAFALESLRPSEWVYFVTRMLLSDTVYEDFRRFVYTNTTAEPIDPCTGSCKKFQICSLVSSSWDEYVACTQK